MRIARIVDSLTWGGVEKAQLTFATELHRRNISLTIMSLDRCDPPIEEPLRALGVRIELFLARGLLNPQRIARIVRFLKQERVDVLQTHLTYGNIIGAMVGRLSGIPTVATLHSAKRVQQERLSDYGREWLETLALRFGVQRVLAVGQVVTRAHQSRIPNKHIHIIPNAAPAPHTITRAERETLRAELCGGDPTRTVLIAVGRLTPAKGFGDLLTAVAQLREHYPTALLVIVGDGELTDTLTAQIASLGLQEHVRLLGYRDDVPRLLCASDVFVSSSHWEGLSWALLEAMATGLPVVATDVGEVPIVLVEGTGLIVPPQNPALLAEGLRSLLDDPARMRVLGEAARQHVNRHYSVSAWVDQHLALYEEMIGEREQGTGGVMQ